MSGELLAVCTVAEVIPDAGRVGRTGIDKQPRTGPVRVTAAGLDDDEICDSEHHGGRDQAVYAYAAEDARRWADELGHEVPPGRFGENLTVEGLMVSDAVVGQRWRVGEQCVLEVTLPRDPCATFARRVDATLGVQEHWVRRFTERGDAGAYLRVLEPGEVRAGDAVEVVHTPEHGVTVRDVFVATDPGAMGRLLREGRDVPAKAAVKAARVVTRAGGS